MGSQFDYTLNSYVIHPPSSVSINLINIYLFTLGFLLKYITSVDPSWPKARVLHSHIIFGSININAEIILYTFKIHLLVIPTLKEHRVLGLQVLFHLV